MSNFCRLISRSTSNVFYVSRMNAHNLPPGSSVKAPEAKSGQHVVSGSGQFIATDGSSASTKTGIGGGSSASMLPGAQTAHDKTNPTKTTGDAKQSHGSKGGPDEAHQSILKSPVGQFGIAAVALVSLYGAYKMLLGNSPDQKANFRDKQARITRPDLQSESDVHAKLAIDNNPKKPHETLNPSTNTKAH
ncbi:unnamed protein product [Adineta steineri]|uniref:Uncharacterized protein n=1 Tax=Adineta steineri TaxID=433720 RepID=A0A814D5P4_9BILA|nr:unnamed protein product [Adineta steineri]CAF1258153.1 unnamed protein product [Adineta steineri]CAF3634887.1 unnamed protein product [Adineta steineri]